MFGDVSVAFCFVLTGTFWAQSNERDSETHRDTPLLSLGVTALIRRFRNHRFLLLARPCVRPASHQSGAVAVFHPKPSLLPARCASPKRFSIIARVVHTSWRQEHPITPDQPLGPFIEESSDAIVLMNPRKGTCSREINVKSVLCPD